MRTVSGKYGQITFFGKDEYIGRSLYAYGEFSGLECEKLARLARNTCIDVGANIGVMSQALASSGRPVIAFEPQEALFKLLSVNFSGEKHNVALGSSEDTTVMPRVAYDRRGNFGGLSCNSRSELGHVKVPVKTLDSYNITDVGLIKIDVEGFEIPVLLGAARTIAKYKPVMFIEDDRLENSSMLRKLITSMGYDITEYNTPLFREDNFFNNKTNIWDHNYHSKNLICLPLADLT